MVLHGPVAHPHGTPGWWSEPPGARGGGGWSAPNAAADEADAAVGPGSDLPQAAHQRRREPGAPRVSLCDTGPTVERPDPVWCADIAYIPVQDGFLYLAAILDWTSRRVLAAQLSNTMDTEFCLGVCRSPYEVSEPRGSPRRPPGSVAHSRVPKQGLREGLRLFGRDRDASNTLQRVSGARSGATAGPPGSTEPHVSSCQGIQPLQIPRRAHQTPFALGAA